MAWEVGITCAFAKTIAKFVAFFSKKKKTIAKVMVT